MITASQFKQMTGYEPENDDLERANCTHEGLIGHGCCGICPKHNQPRFHCGCFNLDREKEMESYEERIVSPPGKPKSRIVQEIAAKQDIPVVDLAMGSLDDALIKEGQKPCKPSQEDNT